MLLALWATATVGMAAVAPAPDAALLSTARSMVAFQVCTLAGAELNWEFTLAVSRPLSRSEVCMPRMVSIAQSAIWVASWRDRC